MRSRSILKNSKSHVLQRRNVEMPRADNGPLFSFQVIIWGDNDFLLALLHAHMDALRIAARSVLIALVNSRDINVVISYVYRSVWVTYRGTNENRDVFFEQIGALLSSLCVTFWPWVRHVCTPTRTVFLTTPSPLTHLSCSAFDPSIKNKLTILNNINIGCEYIYMCDFAFCGISK